MRVFYKAALVAFSLFLISCQTAEMALQEQGGKPLTDNALLELVAGNTAYGIDLHNQKWVEYVAENGTAYFKYSSKPLRVGEWRVDNGAICYKYPTISHQSFCFHYYDVQGEIKAFHSNGSGKGKLGDTIFEYKGGDVEGLMAN